MAEQKVTLRVDLTEFNRAMERARAYFTGFVRMYLQIENHRRELPSRSRMHAAYDRRRRARRRR